MCVKPIKSNNDHLFFGNTYNSSFLFLLFQRNVFRVLTTLLLLLSLFVVDVIYVAYERVCYSLIRLFFFGKSFLLTEYTCRFLFFFLFFHNTHVCPYLLKKTEIRNRKILIIKYYEKSVDYLFSMELEHSPTLPDVCYVILIQTIFNLCLNRLINRFV
jgi:hypothetical protein